MLNVTVDTNVIVSSVICHGNPHYVMRLGKQNLIKVSISMPLLLELSMVLQRRKFKVLKVDRERVLEDILSASMLVMPNLIIQEIHADPADNKVLECAVAADSDYIISGDHHLLDLREFQGIKIVTPQQFLELFYSLSRTS